MKILITYDNKSYELTDEVYNQIMEFSAKGQQKGIWLSGEYIGWGSIKSITEQGQDYHQPYSWDEIPRLMGAENIINHAAQSKKNMEAFIRGLKKSIADMQAEGREPLKALELLKTAEVRYEHS